MGQILIRGVAPGVIRRLKSRARRHRRSLEAELREIVETAAAAADPGDVMAAVRRVRSLFGGRTFTDSATLIRRDRAR
jgi:plasmid stability protein